MKALKPFYDRLDDLQRQLNILKQEESSLSRSIRYVQDDLADFLLNNYVGLDADESFDDHIECVEYHNGFYQSKEAALQDGNVRVFNLKGEQVY